MTKLFEPKIVIYTAKSIDENISEMFVKSLESSVNELYKKFNYNKSVKMKKKDNENYKNAAHCHICEEELNDYKVLNRDHLAI